MPSLEASYRRLRLNQRAESSAEDRLVPAAVWKQNSTLTGREDLRGRACFGGLDLSGLGNLTGKPTGKITVESNSPTQEQKLQDIVDKLTTLVAVTQAKMDRDDRYANRNLERI